MTYTYYRNCVGWPWLDIKREGGLNDMLSRAIDITRRTFLKPVKRHNLRAIESSLGYTAHHTQGLTMAGDYHVNYYRSKLHGKFVYYFTWSGIEYVFTSGS